MFIGTMVTGSGIIAALTPGHDGLQAIVIGGGIGLVAAFPLSWAIARNLYALG